MRIPFDEISLNVVNDRCIVNMNVNIDLSLTPDELLILKKRLKMGAKFPFKNIKEAFITRFEEVEIDPETAEKILESIQKIRTKLN
jgi:hypothetical protein